jgi:signal transduction histidine kinase/ActR/RegA family two-component response regulator
VLAGRPVQFEVEMAAKPGSEPQYMYAAYTPELDGDGRVVGLVAGIVNITERRRAEQAVRDADRRKDEFLATLAHELRNPLAPISNSIDILGRSGANPALLQTVRDTLRRQVSHLTKLVDDLLDVGRISRNKLELRREDVTLAAVLEHSMEACGPMIGEAGQRLAVQLPDQPVVVHGDPVRLSQIFSNLLTNASRYNHQGGHIALSAALDGGEVVVRVRDSGIGIPADQLGAVFEPFFQVRDAASRESGGLGIGLSLVKRLVELHGGSVAAASAGAGHGAEFTVRLPVVRATGVPAPARAAAAPAAAGRRFLVVDDNVDAADSLALLLELSGHVVHKAYNGPDALVAARTHRPEVVILDLGLPGMSGYDVCRRLREHDAGQALLVVALTGWGQPGDRERTADAGFDAHLVKPVDQDVLMAVVRQRFAAGPRA